MLVEMVFNEVDSFKNMKEEVHKKIYEFFTEKIMYILGVTKSFLLLITDTLSSVSNLLNIQSGG